MASNIPYGINNLQSDINYAQMVSNPYNTMGGYMQQAPQYYSQPTMIAPQSQAMPQQASSGAVGGGGAPSVASSMGMLAGGIQAGVGLVDWIKGGKERKKYLKESEQALAGLPQYAVSQYAKEDLANAQAANNSIDPSIMMQYNQLQKGAANTAAMGQRNAMSGAEAINAAIAGQNIAANQAPSIAVQQAQYAMANRNALSRALQGMTAEQQNVFNSKNSIANQMFNYKLGRLGAAEARKADGIKNTVGGINAVGSNLQGMLNSAGSALMKGM